MIRLPVTAGAASHDALVGPIADAAADIAALAGSGPLALVSDSTVLALHGASLPFAFDPILVPAGEKAKRWPVLERLVEELAARNIDRSTPVVALGGGSIGDVTGLAASLFMRGCPVLHLPTTLLAQADSAIGGKTAIDAAGVKNLVGSFHQPALVVADPAFLTTLDPRQLRAGYAEVVKYGLLGDAGFFAWCEANGPALLAGDVALRTEAVTACIRAKAALVADDVEDRHGRRALLNLGHSFGHAIEAVAGFGPVLHGEAVAVGMVLAFRLSEALGLAGPADTARVETHLGAVGLPTTLGDVGLAGAGEALLEAMRGDKKNEGGQLRLVVAEGIGRTRLASVEAAAVRAVLA